MPSRKLSRGDRVMVDTDLRRAGCIPVSDGDLSDILNEQIVRVTSSSHLAACRVAARALDVPLYWSPVLASLSQVAQ